MTGRLRAQVVPLAEVTPALVEQMWAVFDAHYVDVDRARFEADLRSKEKVIVLLDGADVVGFSTFTHHHGEVDGRPYTVAFSGDTVVATPYWGQTALQRAFCWQIFLTWLRNPGRPTYWYLISKGFKTYLLLTRNWIHAWPTVTHPTGAFEARVLHDISVRLFGDSYKPDRGVIVFDTPMGRVRDGLAPPEPALEDPDVRFFVEHNPGHARGEELACLGRLELLLFVYFVLRQLFPGLRRRAR